MLRVFEASIDAVLPLGLPGICGDRRTQVMAVAGEPGEYMCQTFFAEPRSRLQTSQTEASHVQRLEFGSIEQAPQHVEFAAVEFQTQGLGFGGWVTGHGVTVEVLRSQSNQEKSLSIFAHAKSCRFAHAGVATGDPDRPCLG